MDRAIFVFQTTDTSGFGLHASRSQSKTLRHSRLNFFPYGGRENTFGPSSFGAICSKVIFGFSKL